MLHKRDKKEIPAHGKNRKKRDWYRKTGPTDPKMSFEAYVDFLDQNKGLIPPKAPGNISTTDNNKL